MFGVGSEAGAVYVADAAKPPVALGPEYCSVIAFSDPHAAPEQPGPINDQLNPTDGFDPRTGISDACTVAAEPAITLEGPVICKVKLLVIATCVAACLLGSATLCAVTVTIGAPGKICGAVNRPLASTLPHCGAHAPTTLHCTDVSGWPALEIAA